MSSAVKNFLMQHKVRHSYTSCQWPIGDPQEKDFHFCGDATFAKKPYCEKHCDLAYIDEKELKKSKEIKKQSKIAA